MTEVRSSQPPAVSRPSATASPAPTTGRFIIPPRPRPLSLGRVFLYGLIGGLGFITACVVAYAAIALLLVRLGLSLLWLLH